jgi:hypothetical protein
MNPVIAYFTKQGETLTPVNRKPAGVITAVTIPHDLLDHFPDDDGSVEHEFMAIGAMSYNFGDSPFNANGEWFNLLSDMTDVFLTVYYYYCNLERDLRIAPDSEPEFNHLQELVLANFKAEDIVEDLAYISEGIRWVNFGYAQAQLRYAGICRGDLSDQRGQMYGVITTTIKSLPSTDHNELIEVEWDVERGIFEAKLIQVWQVGVIDRPMVLANPSVLHSYDIGKWWVSNHFEEGKTFYFDWNDFSSQADIFGFDVEDAINFPMFWTREDAEAAQKDCDLIDQCNNSYRYYLYREHYVGKQVRITYPKRRKSLI